MHWKIQIVNISITRDMVSHSRGRYDYILYTIQHLGITNLKFNIASVIY